MRLRGPQGTDKMVSITVYMSEYQRQALIILSRSTKIPVSEFVRDGIDKVLQRELPQPFGQLELPFGGGDEETRR